MASAWESRFAEFVRAAANLRESTSLELLPDLMPTMDLLVQGDPALGFLRGERWCTSYHDIAAVAGERAVVTLSIPISGTPGTGLGMAELVDVVLFAGAGMQVYGYPDGGGFALADTNNHTAADGRDARWITAGRVNHKTLVKTHQLTSALGLPAVSLGRSWAANVTTSFSNRLPVNHVFVNGGGYGFVAGSVNVQLVAVCRWRERSLPSRSELQEK